MANRPGNFLYADLRVLDGVTRALKVLDRDVKMEWASAMRTTGTRVWRSAITQRKYLPQDDIFGRPSVLWSMGGKGTARVDSKPLSGTLGVAGGRDMRAVEFGSKKGDPRLKRYDSRGRVAYGALRPFGSYMGQMALKTLADAIREAANVEE